RGEAKLLLGRDGQPPFPFDTVPRSAHRHRGVDDRGDTGKLALARPRTLPSNRRNQQQLVLGEAATDQVFGSVGIDADRHVVSILHQVDLPILRDDLEMHLRMARSEPGRESPEKDVRKQYRRAHPQGPAWTSGTVQQYLTNFGQLVQCRARSFVEQPPFGRGRQPATVAIEKSDAQAFLQLANLARERCLWPFERACRPADAACLYDRVEGLQRPKVPLAHIRNSLSIFC